MNKSKPKKPRKFLLKKMCGFIFKKLAQVFCKNLACVFPCQQMAYVSFRQKNGVHIFGCPLSAIVQRSTKEQTQQSMNIKIEHMKL